ncbi:formate dehydrogenase accessory sulfurtransferase FdhD [soil metagenome]
MDTHAVRSSRGGRTAKVLVQRFDGEGPTRSRPDELIVEEPMAIELDGTRVATTMRTPGHDFELAVGFCFTDGLLGGAPVLRCRYCGTGSAVDTDFNVVTVETGGHAPTPVPRLTTTSSSCGLCGSQSIEELTDRLAPLHGVPAFPLDLLAELPERARAHQPLFTATGAVHAAAAFDRSGELVLLREDIGRHNAVDKVVGRLVLDGRLHDRSDDPGEPVREHRPTPADMALYVSGRASFEMVQKAWAAGFAAVVAVSAPSALAVRTAAVANLQLAGFAREGRLNLYAPGCP